MEDGREPRLVPLDMRTRAQVVDAIDRLAEAGPALGRPLVDSIAHSEIGNLKELRPGSTGRCEVRISFAFGRHRGEAVARYVQALGGQIQISAIFGDDHYVLRGTVTEAA